MTLSLLWGRLNIGAKVPYATVSVAMARAIRWECWPSALRQGCLKQATGFGIYTTLPPRESWGQFTPPQFSQVRTLFNRFGGCFFQGPRIFEWTSTPGRTMRANYPTTESIKPRTIATVVPIGATLWTSTAEAWCCTWARAHSPNTSGESRPGGSTLVGKGGMNPWWWPLAPLPTDLHGWLEA